MRYLIRTTRRRLTRFLVAGSLVGIGMPLLLGAGNAHAATCGDGVGCTVSGSLGITTGTVTLTPPPAMAWTGPPSALDQQMFDATLADQAYEVDNTLGSTTATWSVTASGTQFTRTTVPLNTLPTTGTLSTNGSITAQTDATQPSSTCVSGFTCTPATDTITAYPIAIDTGPTAGTSTIYASTATTGLGAINIGLNGTGTDPVGWWLAVPSNTLTGTYLATITLTVTSAP